MERKRYKQSGRHTGTDYSTTKDYNSPSQNELQNPAVALRVSSVFFFLSFLEISEK